MRSGTIHKLIVVFVFVFAAAVSRAQSPAAIDQVNSVQQQNAVEQSGQLLYDQNQTAPELYPHESDDVGPQSVLSVAPRRTLFEGLADIQYYYSDNVFLDHTTRVPSGILVSSAQFALAPTPYKLWGGESMPRIGFREQWYNFFEYYNQGPYPNLNSYDFTAQTAFAEERWNFGNWFFGAGFDYTRLLTEAAYRQFYTEYVPRWEISRVFRVAKHQALSLSYQGYYHFTDASEVQVLPESGFFDRMDHLFLATYTWEAFPNFDVQPYLAFRYTGFTSGFDRDDYLSTGGLGLYYFMGNYVTARLFVSYDKRYSSVEEANYQQFSAGAGVNLTVRF